MHYIFTLPFALSLLVLLPGCLQQPIRISQQMISDKSKIPNGFSKNKTFMIIGGKYQINGVKQNNKLQDKELEYKLALALEQQGYKIQPVQDENYDVDYAIVYEYGINSRRKTTYEPKYTIDTIWSSKNHAFIDKTTYVPIERTYFTKTLELTVVELPQYIATRKIPSPIWQSEAWIVDESSDMRTNLDFLIVETTSKFGKDTAGTINTDIYNNNKAVTGLRAQYINFEK